MRATFVVMTTTTTLKTYKAIEQTKASANNNKGGAKQVNKGKK